MAFTEDSVLRLLVSAGGQLKKSDLVAHFKESVDRDDPEEKRRNRELFKTCINDVAVVKELDGVRFVVLRKRFRHLLEERRRSDGDEESGERSPVRTEPEPDPEEENMSPVQRALLRSVVDVRVKRMLSFELQKGGPRGPMRGLMIGEEEPSGPPLRTSPTLMTSPSLTRIQESLKHLEKKPEEPKPSSVFPLDPSEHEWLVKCAAGQWNQVLGLLLNDRQLAEKRDFISGFTALHWAAKYGNSHMLVKIMDLAGDGNVDVNARTRGGYTPLHIAALHDQEYILTMLVREYHADVGVRDNCGKRAHHYLHKAASDTVREMLGGTKPPPPPPQNQILLHDNREDLDLLPDLTKGFQSISRLFQPNVSGHRKKHKQRPGFYSLGEDPGEDREDLGFRLRVGSDVF